MKLSKSIMRRLSIEQPYELVKKVDELQKKVEKLENYIELQKKAEAGTVSRLLEVQKTCAKYRKALQEIADTNSYHFCQQFVDMAKKALERGEEK